MAISSITFSGEFFNKESLIKELIEFSIAATSANANMDYQSGVDAVIERLKNRKPELTIT